MGFAEQLLSKIFGPKEVPLTIDSGLIKRSAEHLENFGAWRQKDGEHFIRELRRNVVLSQKDLGNDIHLMWLDERGARGFHCRLDLLSAVQPDWNFMLDELKERLIEIGYQLYNSGYEIHSKEDVLEEKEWYYLKTPLRELAKGSPINQMYGNIRITLTSKQGRHELKFFCTHYSDRNYAEPLPFDELLTELLHTAP